MFGSRCIIRIRSDLEYRGPLLISNGKHFLTSLIGILLETASPSQTWCLKIPSECQSKDI